LNYKEDFSQKSFDKVNAVIAFFIFLISFIVYRLTVQPTLSYWDCGEFIACSYILGIPHPPGSPVFIVLARIFSMIPMAADICFRVNILSVVSSAAAVLFGYLSVVRIIRGWYTRDEFNGYKRLTTYCGGVIGSLCMAFSATYWANAVEAEVYGLSMSIMMIILWLTLQYYNYPGTAKGSKIIILVSYLAMIGVGVHLQTFLIMPIATVVFILKKDAPVKAWIALCGFFIVELLAIILVSNGRGGYPAFLFLSVVFLLATAALVYKYLNWPVLVAIGAFSMIMLEFPVFVYALIAGAVVLIIMAGTLRNLDWRTGMGILLVAAAGYSFHLYIPIRSAENPRIDENNPDRNFETFVSYIDRKQYGSTSMVERMFERRGTWEHQFGRHANMGFWSYFEEQYGLKPIFGLLFLLGLFGIYAAIKKRVQIGLPFLIMVLLGTAGLVLYMNFADGIKYNAQTGDAYQEVRNRDYFFTPGFAIFGLALGLGAAAVMDEIRKRTSATKFSGFRKPAMAASMILVLLPLAGLSDNYFENDRSINYFPKIYSENFLNTCKKDAILFTSGDNDTFPLWCLQEVYDYRKDVRVVNLSLFNTDWYVAQMKNQYNVPISLTDDQILWNTYYFQGKEIKRPKDPFYDRPRKRKTYLIPLPHEGRIVKLQDMMVDEVVLENRWRYPIYFSSEPYEESPLNLQDMAVATGVVYELDTTTRVRPINAEEGYRLYMNVYKYDGLNNPNISRDENATGVMLSLGFNALRIADEFRRTGQTERAKEMLRFSIDKFPEFLQSYSTLSDIYKQEGDTGSADSVMAEAEKMIGIFSEKNPSNTFYLSDLGLVKYYRGKIEDGLDILWRAFRMNPNNGYAYRKLFQVLYETRRTTELIKATQMHAEYKVNLTDPLVQQVLGIAQPQVNPSAPLQQP
jgi:hypothetical protein